MKQWFIKIEWQGTLDYLPYRGEGKTKLSERHPTHSETRDSEISLCILISIPEKSLHAA